MISPDQERFFGPLQSMKPFFKWKLTASSCWLPVLYFLSAGDRHQVKRALGWSFWSLVILCEMTTPYPTSEASNLHHELMIRIRHLEDGGGCEPLLYDLLCFSCHFCQVGLTSGVFAVTAKNGFDWLDVSPGPVPQTGLQLELKWHIHQSDTLGKLN